MIGRTSILSSLLFLLTISAASAQEQTVIRFVEFRDGSIMRLPVVNDTWKISLVRGTGTIDAETTTPADLQSLMLTHADDFDKKRKLLSAVQQLGADEFVLREKAYKQLLAMGAEIRPDLHACLQLTKDVETQIRLHDLLKELPPPAKKDSGYRIAFDRFRIKSAKDKSETWGFLADQPIRVVVEGKKYSLSRKDVARITVATEKKDNGSATQAGFQRISDNQFPHDCVHESFENDPTSGRRLRVGENIEKLFAKKGFVLSTSIKSSFVSVNTFSVSGKSRGWSIANHSPLWQGAITIRFVEPGREHMPAGVTFFGCYIAAVVPNGTTLIAYDRHDNELGKILTRQSNTEFLGVRSIIPIHKIRIVPNETLDRDFTLDDFMFLPAPATRVTHPERFSVSLNGGDLILCREVTLTKDNVHLRGLPAVLPDLTLPIADLQRINMPQKGNLEKQKGMFAELEDGSIVFAPQSKDARSMPEFARAPNLLKNRKGLIGIWTTDFARSPYRPIDKRAVMWDADQQNWQPITYVRLLEEVVLWKNADDEYVSAGYERLPPMWFAAPRDELQGDSWNLRTIQDEELILSKATAPIGKLSEGVRVVWQGRSLMIPASEVTVIYRPAKK